MAWRKQDKNPAYGSAEWKRKRLACLQAARWRCQIRGPHCQGAAVIADHVYGLRNDPRHEHLQAACQRCSDEKTSRESSRGHRDPPGRLIGW
jgi:5-methylcytosine-specific restriction endonuclease McrA